jgi:hypothetical protein
MHDLLRAVAVQVTEDALVVDLDDGRVLHVPLVWFPRLLKADAAQRKNVSLVGRGIGLHWPELDEDLSVVSLMQGRARKLLRAVQPLSPPRDVIEGQLSGYWLDRDRPVPPRPTYAYTGAFLPRRDEKALVDFLCLDLVRVDAGPGPGFVWLPLSDVGRYTYAHSLGLLYGEAWRLVVYDCGGIVQKYEAAYGEALLPEQIACHYGDDAALRARQDYPTVQLRLRRLP